MSKPSGLGRGLGRGLEALLGDDAKETTNETPAANTDEVDIFLIDANPWQPRTEFQQDELDELCASIKSYGIIQPLTLRKMPSGRYQIIAGERRFRAAKQAGLKRVPAYIREVGDDKMLAVALIENIQRSNLNPIEEALSYQRLIDECNLTQETMADQVGKKRSTVTNYLRLLKLPKEIQQGLRDKSITMGHARAIMGVDDEETQLMLFHETVEQGYSVRRVEEMVRDYNEKGGYEPTEEPDEQQPDEQPEQKKPLRNADGSNDLFKMLGDQLTNYFSTPVKMTCNAKGKGKITIPFANTEELERIMEILDSARQNPDA